METRNKRTDPMTPLKMVAERITANLQESPSSATELIPFSPPPRPKPVSLEVKVDQLSAVLDKWRLSQGWQPMADDDHDAMIAVWMEAFDVAGVAPDAYHELYLDALRVRGTALANGQNPPAFAPELFISLWPALRDRRERAAVESGRQLPPVAMSACPLCNGSGWEPVEREGYRGVRRCSNGCKPKG